MTGDGMWDLIRDGMPPTSARIAQVAAEHRVFLGDDGSKAMEATLRHQVLGAGPLEPLLEDETVTDVLVNGADAVWVDRGEGLVTVPVDLGDAADVRRLAVRLAGLAGRRLDDASPYVDGLLPGGVRLHAILPPLVDGGAHLSLRVPRRCAPSLGRLAEWGTVGDLGTRVLCELVASRVSFLVTGGTGTGKTTLLAALLGEVDAAERIVVVEDVREMAIRHPHVVRLQARPANVEARGSVDLTTLVRQSLRMRPDRLVVGEVRGAEVRELLTALNTGHEGGCGTVHANGIADVVARFEALGALAGMSPEATRTQLVTALRVVVHLRRLGGRRVVDTVGVVRQRGAGVEVVPALRRVAGRSGREAAGSGAVTEVVCADGGCGLEALLGRDLGGHLGTAAGLAVATCQEGSR